MTLAEITRQYPYLSDAPDDLLAAYRASQQRYAIRPVNTSCRFCGDPIPLFVDSAHYCCRECRDCAWLEMGGFDGA